MKLELRRTWVTAQATIGELFVDGIFECYTLEGALRSDGVKIAHQTCIPAGRYAIALTYSNRFKVIMPQLLNVPGFEGIRIHPGNSAVDTSGCILVGRKRGVDWIGESRLAYAQLYRHLAVAVGSVVIDIVDPDFSPIRQRLKQSGTLPNDIDWPQLVGVNSVEQQQQQQITASVSPSGSRGEKLLLLLFGNHKLSSLLGYAGAVLALWDGIPAEKRLMIQAAVVAGLGRLMNEARKRKEVTE